MRLLCLPGDEDVINLAAQDKENLDSHPSPLICGGTWLAAREYRVEKHFFLNLVCSAGLYPTRPAPRSPVCFPWICARIALSDVVVWCPFRARALCDRNWVFFVVLVSWPGCLMSRLAPRPHKKGTPCCTSHIFFQICVGIWARMSLSHCMHPHISPHVAPLEIFLHVYMAPQLGYPRPYHAPHPIFFPHIVPNFAPLMLHTRIWVEGDG